MASVAIHCSRAPAPETVLSEIPHLQKQGTATQLIVDGKPFLMLAGELHNSSSSSLEYMNPIWPKLARMNLNTVLVALSWELVEPEEGKFDFALVDGLIQQARREDLRVIFLWFGSWKNGKSSYVPAWVKEDVERFPRVRVKDRESIEILSTFAAESRDADARAFAALMRHIREVDGREQTVIMMQVENEVGVLGDSRDRCEAADKAFAAAVPQGLLDYLRKNKDNMTPELHKMWEAKGFPTAGTWEEVFGTGPAVDEAFMAWHYASYIDHVAAAGRAEYDLPMFANAWPSSPDKKPGDWPSGGPLYQVMDLWKTAAPHIDIVTPDIYGQNFAEWCQWYKRLGNPLFIAETFGGEAGAANVFYALGEHDAMAFSPFGIDTAGVSFPSGETTEEEFEKLPMARSYAVLEQLAPLILEKQGTDEMSGALLEGGAESAEVKLGGYTMKVTPSQFRKFVPEPPPSPLVGPQPPRGGAIFISMGPDEFLIAGSTWLNVSFSSDVPGPANVGILSIDEGSFAGDGSWVSGRRLNGDLTGQGERLILVPYMFADDYPIRRVKLYRY
jgi:uncharacterized protein DUF5597/glycosyl hydrolase family 42 (putative beta-galactosidase)